MEWVLVLALPLRSCDLGKPCRTSVSPFGEMGEEEYLSFEDSVEMLRSGDYVFALWLAPEIWSEGISDRIGSVEGVHVKSGVHSYQSIQSGYCWLKLFCLNKALVWEAKRP